MSASQQNSAIDAPDEIETIMPISELIIKQRAVQEEIDKIASDKAAKGKRVEEFFNPLTMGRARKFLAQALADWAKRGVTKSYTFPIEEIADMIFDDIVYPGKTVKSWVVNDIIDLAKNAKYEAVRIDRDDGTPQVMLKIPAYLYGRK